MLNDTDFTTFYERPVPNLAKAHFRLKMGISLVRFSLGPNPRTELLPSDFYMSSSEVF